MAFVSTPLLGSIDVETLSLCLAYIKEVWTDMRPLSLCKRMEELAKQKAASTEDTEA